MYTDIKPVLRVLECCLRYGRTLSLKQLSIKARLSETKVKYMLCALEKRGYLKKAKDRQEYVVTEKIMMFV